MRNQATHRALAASRLYERASVFPVSSSTGAALATFCCPSPLPLVVQDAQVESWGSPLPLRVELPKNGGDFFCTKMV